MSESPLIKWPWSLYLSITATILLFILGSMKVDISLPHLVKPSAVDGVVIIILLVAIWLVPHNYSHVPLDSERESE